MFIINNDLGYIRLILKNIGRLSNTFWSHSEHIHNFTLCIVGMKCVCSTCTMGYYIFFVFHTKSHSKHCLLSKLKLFLQKNKFKIKLLIIVALSFWREHLQILSKKQSYNFMLVIESYVCHSPVIKNSLGNIFEREGSQRSDKKLYESDAFMFTSLVAMIFFDLFVTYFKETESSQKVIFS